MIRNPNGRLSQVPELLVPPDSGSLIHRLPTELVLHIGRYVVDLSRPLGFDLVASPARLLAVCSRWRAIFQADAAFWVALEDAIHRLDDPMSLQLETTPDRDLFRALIAEQRMIKSFLHRSLAAYQGKQTFEDVREDPVGFGSEETRYADLPAQKRAQLLRLALSTWDVVGRLRHQESFASDGALVPAGMLGRLAPLTRLTISHLRPSHPRPHAVGVNLFHLLQDAVLPNLAELKINPGSFVSFAHPLATSSTPSIIHLPSLVSLDVHVRGPGSHKTPDHHLDSASTIFSLPRLAHLEWEDSYESAACPAFFRILFPPSPHQTNVAHLETFSPPDDWRVSSEPMLLAQIHLCSNLVSLHLSASQVTDFTVRALRWPDREEPEEDSAGLCPRLVDLDLGENSSVTGEEVCRMVQSRLDGADNGECAAISWLRITDIVCADPTREAGDHTEETIADLSDLVEEVVW